MRSPKAFWGSVLLIGALMLVWNLLTPMMADDFAYSYSFATGERVSGFDEIFLSLEAHAQTMNGRTVAHFFAQLFLLLPAWIFDLCNAAMLVCQLLLMLRICGVGERTRCPMLWMLFAVMLIATPDFGQVNLWLDGACNYLFSTVFVLAFLLPYVSAFLRERKMRSPIQIPVFWILSFLAGAYLENVSGGAILIAFLLWIANLLYGKRQADVPLLIGLLCSVAGLATMALSPAQFENKASAFSWDAMLQTLGISLGVIGLLALPIGLFLFLWYRAARTGVARRVILTALIFAVGGLASNFVMVLAAYYPLRCAVGCTVYMTLAAGILAAHMEWEITASRTLTAVCRVMAAALLLTVVVGTVDIAATHHAILSNEARIVEARDAGEESVTLICPTAFTKYSGLYNLKYLGIGTPYDWPNDSMAKYYGIKGIIGAS